MQDLRTLQRIALEVASNRSIKEVLDGLVQGLAADPSVALARIWLLGPGDVCADCRLREECADQTRCLHLVASAGRSLVRPEEHWNGVDGQFRRFPIGVRKVGRIGGSGRGEYLCMHQDDSWLADAEWAQRERLQSFAGQPLVFRGEVLGVLAIFNRRSFDDEEFALLRTFADQAAIALANARAFEEVDELRRQLELERDYLREEIRVVRAFGGIVGQSPGIRNVLQQVEVVAPTDATVLVQGESGTGKELIADAIHERSLRAERPLVRVNCASIPHELFESEFFGHRRGSFTGATGDRAGRFQVADGGTLFLDEVGEIPLELQGKLLRALQEGSFSRVGEDAERRVDVRVIAATNRDLAAEVEAGRFREDLYYRITVFPIEVPPLRDRREDVPLLVVHFLERAGLGREVSNLRQGELDALCAYDWPGNVRELSNVVERAVIHAGSGRLTFEPPSTRPAAEPETRERALMTYAQLEELQRQNVLAVLDRHGWKISGADGAADFLGVHPATLASRLKAMGIERPRHNR